MSRTKKREKRQDNLVNLSAAVDEYLKTLWIRSDADQEAYLKKLEDIDPDPPAETLIELIGTSQEYQRASSHLKEILQELHPQTLDFDRDAESFVREALALPAEEAVGGRQTGIVGDLLEDSDIETVKSQFLELAESLPRDYEVTARLARCPDMDTFVEPVDLGAGYRFLKPPPGTLENVRDENQWLWMTGVFRGYVGADTGFQSREKEVEDRLLQALGLLEALGLLSSRIFSSMETLGSGERLRQIQIRGSFLSGQGFQKQLSMGEVFSKHQSTFATNDKLFTAGDNVFEFGADGKRLGKAEVAKRRLEVLEGIFEGGDDADRILLAAAWLMKMNNYTDLTEQVIACTTGFEALLGEPEKTEGVQERLAERLAFLLTAPHSKRVEMKKDFKKAYKLRSALLHRGRIASRYEERVKATDPTRDEVVEQLALLSMWLRQAIAKEAQLWHANR